MAMIHEKGITGKEAARKKLNLKTLIYQTGYPRSIRFDV